MFWMIKYRLINIEYEVKVDIYVQLNFLCYLFELFFNLMIFGYV